MPAELKAELCDPRKNVRLYACVSVCVLVCISQGGARAVRGPVASTRESLRPGCSDLSALAIVTAKAALDDMRNNERCPTRRHDECRHASLNSRPTSGRIRRST